MLLVLMCLVLVLLVLILLVLMGKVKMSSPVKNSGASPVSLMNGVRNTVFDRLQLKNSTYDA